MNHSQIGMSQPVTDTVRRAMELLKDRPLPKPKADTRQNFRRGRPAEKLDRSPPPEARDEPVSDDPQQQSDQRN